MKNPDQASKNHDVGYIGHALKEKEKDLDQPLSSHRLSENSPITVDRNCLNCSGNKNPVLKAFKSSCLMYSQNSVNYGAQKFQISELMQVKESILAEC